MGEWLKLQWDDLGVFLDGVSERLGVSAWILGLAGTALTTLVFILLVKLVSVLRNRIKARIEARTASIRPVKFQAQEILSSADIARLITGALEGFRYLVLAMLLYLYLNIVFAFFPPTRSLGYRLFSSVLSAAQYVLTEVVNYLPNLLVIFLIFFLSKYLLKLMGLVFTGIARQRIRIPGFYPEWAQPTFNILRFLVIAFTLVVIFPYLPGSESPAFRGVSLFLGVLFSLGSTAAVANVVAGVLITYMRAFRIGDRVRIADAEGDVVEKNLLVTRIRSVKNVEIAIPNAMVLANHIVNFSALAKDEGLMLHTQVTIGYDVDWRQVEELLVAAARKTEGIETDPAPFVLKKSLDDFYVTYELNAATCQVKKMPRLYSMLHQNILDEFNAAGVEINSPHFSAVRDGNVTAMPSDYLPNNYEPPAFRLHPLERLFTRGTEKK